LRISAGHGGFRSGTGNRGRMPLQHLRCGMSSGLAADGQAM